MQYFIKNNYYFDIDSYNQFRITGPDNHLLMGLTFPEHLAPTIQNYGIRNDQLVINCTVPSPRLTVHLPLVTDIRTLRSHIEPIVPHPTYRDLFRTEVTDVFPKTVQVLKKKIGTTLRFTNSYTDSSGKLNTYGCELIVGEDYSATIEDKTITITGPAPLQLQIRTISTIKIKEKLRKKVFVNTESLSPELFSAELIKLYHDMQTQIEHLVRSLKTSSFEYGTIFPRDWIESADLGVGDLSESTVDYMYDQSMKFISETGEGWHENLIGEYLTKVSNEVDHVDRKMIDIEPRYILGIRQVSKHFLTNENHQKKLRIVARFLMEQALEHELISFKKKGEVDEYQLVGNWRDSYYAYPRQKSPLSPYDVNSVFYPVALKIIRQYAQFLDITDISGLNELIEKWTSQKSKFRLYHQNNIIGYSLALHGKKNVPLPIAHLDESYDLFYGSPSLEEVASFAKKIVDPAFFYTPVGPLLVAADEDEFTTRHYHGKVIWPKQAAYSVAGLTKQYSRGLRESWPWPVMDVIKDAVIQTSQSCFRGWLELGCVPELYYYDEVKDRARLYTDQKEYEGQMSLIQLWSSVGCRRIMRDYVSMMKMGSVE